MFKRAYKEKKEIADFKKRYSAGEIHSEPVINFSNEAFTCKNTSFNEWSDNYSRIIIVNNFRNEYLEATFGKCDFSFRGNRLYKNYLLDFNNTVFIVATTIEVVINNKKDRNQLLTDIGDFEKMLATEVLKFKLNQLKSPKNESEEKLSLYLSDIKTDDNGNIIWNKEIQKKSKMKI